MFSETLPAELVDPVHTPADAPELVIVPTPVAVNLTGAPGTSLPWQSRTVTVAVWVEVPSAGTPVVMTGSNVVVGPHGGPGVNTTLTLAGVTETPGAPTTEAVTEYVPAWFDVNP
jgi:hypothetical protein